MNVSEALAIKNVSKAFPGVQALKNVDFDVKYGEIHALVGENGAGKSTLMNVLMGILKADEGEILLDGKAALIREPLEALTLGIGMVPQEINLVPELSVAENIFLGLEKKKANMPIIDWNRTYSQADDLIKKLGINIDVRQNTSNLSVAYLQLIQIARVMAFGAKILLLDEPSACLTFSETKALFDLLLKFKNEGKAIVFISHHMDEIMQISDRVTVMRDGAVVDTVNSCQTNIKDIITMMAGREVIYEKKDRATITNEAILKVEKLTKKCLFENVSFEVRKGEIFGIAGLVGAGRTELAKTIYGDIKKTSGKIVFENKVVNILSPNHAIKLGIGYLPEERLKEGIFPLQSVAENMVISILKELCTGGCIRGSRKRVLVDKYIRDFNIKTPSQEQTIKNLSGGNQQKVILSRWLARDVKFLMLDEPTRGIDVQTKSEIHDLIQELTRLGKTVIVISSEIEELIKVADRIMVMHEGQVKGFIDAVDATSEKILIMALNE